MSTLLLLVLFYQDILGEVSRFSLDQAGSRFLQRNLSIASREIFDKVFEEAFVNIGPFMVDTYANYIVQVSTCNTKRFAKAQTNYNHSMHCVILNLLLCL